MCDERERLIGFVYDECDPAERRAITRHLEACETCRTEIGGLRDVRQDLLAWDVEGGPSVWRPFVVPVVQPWYRQVPAWAMAAAATLMFLIGAAGGFVTQSLMRANAAPAVADAVTAVPVRSAAVELSAAEQRIVDRLRAELVAQLGAARTTPATPVNAAATNPDQLMQRVNNIVEESEQRLLQLVLDSNNSWIASTASSNAEIQTVKRTLEKVQEAVYTQGGGGGR